ncbi:MAG: hypothetical protein R3240_07985, partial [Gammaproteobacteria bacterium]|nr:hypothetical protein [Gammaproteobacteria bacterium]
DGVLGIPLDQHCDSANWIANPDLYYPGPEAYDCTNIDDQTSSVLLVDVRDPEHPKTLYEFTTTEKAHGLAITREPDSGKYLIALNVGTERLLFYESNVTDLRDPTLRIDLIDTWSRTELPAADQVEWYTYQSLNFVRQRDGALYLIGGDNNSSTEPVDRGDDFAWLFKVERSGTGPGSEFTLHFVRTKHIETESPQMGNFKAGGGAYVSPRGELILYTAHHDPNLTDGILRVAMGEFRHIDVTHDATLEMADVDGNGRLENTCTGWVELYEAANGWNQYRSLMFDFRDRHLDNWENLGLHENFNDKTSAVRWNLPKGQKAWLYEAANYNLNGYRRIELTGYGVVEDMSQPFSVNNINYTNWNDKISSVRFSPVDDLGVPYQGSVNMAISLDTANSCYADNEPSVTFTWELNSPHCTILNSNARRPSIQCNAIGTHSIKLKVTDTLINESVEKTGQITIN